MSDSAGGLGDTRVDSMVEQGKGLLALALGAFEVILAQQRAITRWNSFTDKKRRALIKAYPAGREVRRVQRRSRQAKRQARRVVRAAGRRAQRARRRRGGK